MRPRLSRRSLLTVAGSGATVVLGGCTDRSDSTAGSNRTPDIDIVKRPGGAPPVSIEVEPESGDETPTDSGDATPSDSDSGSSPDWMMAVEAAGEHVASILESRSLLDGPGGVGWGNISHNERSKIVTTPIEGHLIQSHGVRVTHAYYYDREGNLVQSPTVEFESVVDATPRTVHVTLSFPEREYAATVLVLCERAWVQEQ